MEIRWPGVGGQACRVRFWTSYIWRRTRSRLPLSPRPAESPQAYERHRQRPRGDHCGDGGADRGGPPHYCAVLAEFAECGRPVRRRERLGRERPPATAAASLRAGVVTLDLDNNEVRAL